MPKTALTLGELQTHFDEQLGFLERSAASFDEGFEDEAKRLAVTIRVLLHDTQQSHSLLGQLSQGKRPFVNTAFDFNPANLATHGGLVFVAVGPPKTRYVAMLDDVPIVKQTAFDDWWNAPVFLDKGRRSFSRRDLVLIAANQDGGAHVDPGLDEAYHHLSKSNSLGIIAVEGGEARPMEGPERAAIRQIAHEVLKTLKPGYQKKPAHEAGFFTSSMSVVAGGPAVVVGKKVGRNDRCLCGSGKKYKRCCGRVAA